MLRRMEKHETTKRPQRGVIGSSRHPNSREVTMRINTRELVMRFGIAVVVAMLSTNAGPARAEPFAYITNNGNNTVSVIDTATNTVTATIPVGSEPFGVGVSPDGSRVYVANGRPSNSVSVIDTNPSSPSFNTVIATVAVGLDPEGLAVSPDGTRVYVANSEANSVSVIDTATNTVVATVPVGQDPNTLAVAPDGAKVYVIGRGSRVIATATNTVTGSLPVSGAGSVAFHPDGTRAYVANGSRVLVIDAVSNMVTASVPIGATLGIAVSPDGTRIYASNALDDTVSVIDAASNAIIAAVPVGTSPDGLAVTPDSSRVYVANIGGDTVSVIITATNSVGATITLPPGSQPRAVGKFIGPELLAIRVSINIKPGSDPNSINTCSGGSTPVAIFGSDTLDVTTINPNSLVLASASVKKVGKSDRILCSTKDIGSVDTAFFDDLDPTADGFDDLVCHFVTIELTTLTDTSTAASLTGNLTDTGATPITGEDSVKIVKDCDPSP